MGAKHKILFIVYFLLSLLNTPLFACNETLTSLHKQTNPLLDVKTLTNAKKIKIFPLNKTQIKDYTNSIAKFRKKIWQTIETKSDQEIHRYLKSLFEYYISTSADADSNGHLPGRDGQEGDPKTVEDIIENYLTIHSAPKHFLTEMHGNILGPLTLRFQILDAFLEPIENKNELYEFLKNSMDLQIRAMHIEIFKRRLRDGKWTFFNSNDQKKRYSKLRICTFWKQISHITSSDKWINFNFSTNSYEKLEE